MYYRFQIVTLLKADFNSEKRFFNHIMPNKRLAHSAAHRNGEIHHLIHQLFRQDLETRMPETEGLLSYLILARGDWMAVEC
jgi:hypothetical protein